MKLMIVLASVIAVTVAQRPTYAGLSSKGYPGLASRFRDPADDENVNAVNTVAVGNRIGADDTSPPQNLPTDARGDTILVDRLNQWPRENQPFWLLNAQHIDKHRHPNENLNQQQQNLNTAQQGVQQRVDEIQPNLNRSQQGFNQEQQTVGTNQVTQQRLNEIQPILNRNQQGLNQDLQSFGTNQQPVQGVQPNGDQTGQIEVRFGEPVATETRTIKPIRQRASFAGERN